MTQWGPHTRKQLLQSKRPRDMLLLLKDTLSIEDDHLFKACRSVYSSVPQLLEARYPHPKCVKFQHF